MLLDHVLLAGKGAGAVVRRIGRAGRTDAPALGRIPIIFVLALLTLALLLLPTATTSASSHYTVSVSVFSDRSAATALDGSVVSGDIYVFTSPDDAVSQVDFFIDGVFEKRERNGPFDLAGTNNDAGRTAMPFDTLQLVDGAHTLTAEMDLSDASVVTVVAAFAVANGAPALVASPQSRAVALHQGEFDESTVSVTSSDADAASYTAQSDAAWLTATPQTGQTPDSLSVLVDASALSVGVYSGNISLQSPTHSTAVVPVTLTVVEPFVADQVHLAWTQDPSTSMTIIWRTLDTEIPSEAQFRRLGDAVWTPAAGAQRASGTAGTLHEVTLASLTPDTVYEYQVLGEGSVWSNVFTTRTAPPPGPADFDAVYVADTGLIGRLDGLATGTEQVRDEIAALDPLVVLLGGDYAYFDSDNRFGSLENTIDAWFNQMQPIGSGTPMMPAYGNHETLLSEGYEFWSARFATPAGTGGVDNRQSYSFDIGDAHFVSIYAVTNLGDLPNPVLAWIEQDILDAQAAGARWIVPFFHVSPFSDGTNHPSNLDLRAQLGPLFERLGVKVVVASHDQAYERSYPLTDVPASNTPTSSSLSCYDASDGVTWLTVSPGGKLSNRNDDFSRFATSPPPAWTAFRDNTMHHFARLSFSAAGSLRVDTYGVVGDGTPPVVLDSFQYTTEACPPELLFDPPGQSITVDEGGTASAQVSIGTNDGNVASFSVVDDAGWLSVTPASGDTPSGLTLTADATSLVPGSYMATVTATAAGYAPATLAVSLSVTFVGGSHDLLVSRSSDRSAPVPLDGQTVAGDIYVFTGPDDGVSQVEFFIDGAFEQREGNAPYDLAGTNGDATTTAKPYDTTQLADGQHVISAEIALDNGRVDSASATVTVANTVPAIAFSPGTLAFELEEDATSTASVVLDVPDPTPAAYTLSGGASWLTVSPASGETPATLTVEVDSTGLAVGEYTASVTASADGYAPGVLSVSLAVTEPALVFSPQSLSLSVEEGGTTSAPVTLDTNDGGVATFSIVDDADWLSVTPASGDTPSGLTLTADASALVPGSYTATVTATAAGYAGAALDVTLTVSVVGEAYQLLLSQTADRSSPVPLAGQTVAGDIYVFTGPDDGVSQVEFFIDGAFEQREGNAPYDLAGTNGDATRTAKPYDTTQLADGQHVISADLSLSDGSTLVLSASVTVANTAPSLVFAPGTLAFDVEAGATSTATALLDTSNATPAAYTLSGGASWLAVSPASGETSATLTMDVDSTGLAVGEYAASVTASADGYAPGVLSVSLAVTEPALVFSPQSLSLSVEEGGTTSAPVTLDTNDSGVATFSIVDDADWLSVTPASGDTPSGLTLTADATSLVPGSYTATVTATSAGYAGAALDVALTVSVAGGAYQLLLSQTADRSSPVPLDGQTVAGDIYVFTAPDDGVTRVEFFIDGAFEQRENNAPYDLAGTRGGPARDAKPYDTTQLVDGQHVISVDLSLSDGSTLVLSASVTVANAAPSLVFAPGSLTFHLERGATSSAQLVLDTPDGATAAYTLAGGAPWLSVAPTSGNTPASIAVTVDTAGLETAAYTAAITASADGYSPASVHVYFRVAPALAYFSGDAVASTTVAIVGEDFLVNGGVTYPGQTWEGHRIEGLLLNSRMINGVYDDMDGSPPETMEPWDPRHSTEDFIANMPDWRSTGMLAFTVNFQGGSNRCASLTGDFQTEDIDNNPFGATGTVAFDDWDAGRNSAQAQYLARMGSIIRTADDLGLVVILGIFYFGQDEALEDEAAVIAATDATVDWVLANGWTNVLIEVNNEANLWYQHDILNAFAVHTLIQRVKDRSSGPAGAHLPHGRLLVSSSMGSGPIPPDSLIEASDFVLTHGNTLGPDGLRTNVDRIRDTSVWQANPKPIVFNEDSPDLNKFDAAVEKGTSWGYRDDEYQCPESDNVTDRWTLGKADAGFWTLVSRMSGVTSVPVSFDEVIEAESLALTSYAPALYYAKWIVVDGTPSGEATGAFPGPAGTYLVYVQALAEKFGQSTLELWVDGALVATFSYPPSELVKELILFESPAVSLNAGSEIRLVGFADEGPSGTAAAALDRIGFVAR